MKGKKRCKLMLIALIACAAAGIAKVVEDARWSEKTLLALKPAGNYKSGAVQSFKKGQPIVGAYYFYWYRHETGEHFIDPDKSDALVDHPLKPETVSYLSEDWHRKELLDMKAANLDFLLPVWWGNPADRKKGTNLNWSFAGIPPLVRAAQKLQAEGKNPPKIGLLYDTSTLQHNAAHHHIDLTTSDGKAWFYVSIRDFFSLVPPDLRACIDGKPLILLYAPDFARAQDKTLADYVKKHFKQDFGVEPYFVPSVGWQTIGDDLTAWGSAINGLQIPGQSIATLGPGYDDHAVPGRTTPKKERENGLFYSRQWQQLLALPPAARPKLVMCETWNEYHEGTDIAESKEYNRQYIDLTARYAAQFKKGEHLKGKYTDAETVSIMFDKLGAKGLTWSEKEDGLGAVLNEASIFRLTTRPNRFGDWRYLYFDVDNSFYFSGDASDTSLRVRVDYEQDSALDLSLHYDGREGAFQTAQMSKGPGSEGMASAIFTLPDARFTGRANGADFRLSHSKGTLKIYRITLRKGKR